jgi:hypothetical protein
MILWGLPGGSATVAMEAPEEQQQQADLGALALRLQVQARVYRHGWPGYGAWIHHAWDSPGCLLFGVVGALKLRQL